MTRSGSQGPTAVVNNTIAPSMIVVAGKGSMAEAKMVRIPDHCHPAARPIKIETGCIGKTISFVATIILSSDFNLMNYITFFLSIS
jgi:hypothetical protein